MLCGPQGSGKTKTLFSALRKLSNMDSFGLNFSSPTTFELIFKIFDQHCKYKKPLLGLSWPLSKFANGSLSDKYGSQKVISFIRQLVEGSGFWQPSDKVWIKLERIQFVGARNPPTDPGWVTLSQKFLCHEPLVMVD
ncbi:hypothetical protein PPACK8108_LOCUS22358 [Phakopsora pachyrhizi]|uniref:Uncharacterized protein n=1 Tax=Phakopsora pachyrhizi TaxID=170000 RepID=A0AAV0BLP3_PHAPC|nr:hypothetical protein PPACK8108_LOCUS22358 [Phakopsora pachyrhizi]